MQTVAPMSDGWKFSKARGLRVAPHGGVSSAPHRSNEWKYRRFTVEFTALPRAGMRECSIRDWHACAAPLHVSVGWSRAGGRRVPTSIFRYSRLPISTKHFAPRLRPVKAGTLPMNGRSALLIVRIVEISNQLHAG